MVVHFYFLKKAVIELIVLESIADSTDEIVYTPTEKRLIHKLRTMLKDTEVKHLRTLNTLVEKQHGERWSDQQLLVYLEMAIGDINAEPPYTGFTLDNFPSSIETTVILGALVFSLIAESILQVGKRILSLTLNLFNCGKNSISLISYNEVGNDKRECGTI